MNTNNQHRATRAPELPTGIRLLLWLYSRPAALLMGASDRLGRLADKLIAVRPGVEQAPQDRAYCLLNVPDPKDTSPYDPVRDGPMVHRALLAVVGLGALVLLCGLLGMAGPVVVEHAGELARMVQSCLAGAGGWLR